MDDFEHILGLVEQLWPDKQLSRNEIRKVYARGLESLNDYLICAEADGEIAGFGCMVVKNSFWQESYVGYITTLVVDEEQRNTGIGKGLISMLSKIAKDEGCKRIELDSGFHREQAHLFYEHLGFHKRAYLFSKEI
ncbi:GNAT family N-acetyltransferase [Paenibacillus tarimensis]